MSQVLPQFDPTTRTLKVRLEMANPDFALRPDMFVDVEFPVTLPPTVSVPVDAVLDSGLKKTVFVERGDGYFEPRQVETGWRLGDRVQILNGSAAGGKDRGFREFSHRFGKPHEARGRGHVRGGEPGPGQPHVCGRRQSRGQRAEE